MKDYNIEEQQAPIVDPSNSSLGNRSKLLILLAVVMIAVISFGSGYLLNNLLPSDLTPDSAKPTPQPSPLPSSSPDPVTPNNFESFTPGDHYYVDTVFLVTKEEPHYTLIATSSRNEEGGEFVHSSKVSYFDGQDWTRETTTKKADGSKIEPDEIIRSWNIDINQTRVLKEMIDGEIVVKDIVFKFDTGELQSDFAVRSLPSYTKFLSPGEGSLTIDDQHYDTYVLYSRVYSSNAAGIQFYDDPFDITTSWMAFWDIEGNFYHLDVTDVAEVADIYGDHKIGVVKYKDGLMAKTFEPVITMSGEIPPTNYTIEFPSPIDSSLVIESTHSLNKFPNSSYDWYTSMIEGKVILNSGSEINGLGIAEYIHK